MSAIPERVEALYRSPNRQMQGQDVAAGGLEEDSKSPR